MHVAGAVWRLCCDIGWCLARSCVVVCGRELPVGGVRSRYSVTLMAEFMDAIESRLDASSGWRQAGRWGSSRVHACLCAWSGSGSCLALQLSPSASQSDSHATRPRTTLRLAITIVLCTPHAAAPWASHRATGELQGQLYAVVRVAQPQAAACLTKHTGWGQPAKYPEYMPWGSCLLRLQHCKPDRPSLVGLLL